MPTAVNHLRRNIIDKPTAVTNAENMQDKRKNEHITKPITLRTEQDYNKQQSEQEQ